MLSAILPELVLANRTSTWSRVADGNGYFKASIDGDDFYLDTVNGVLVEKYKRVSFPLTTEHYQEFFGMAAARLDYALRIDATTFQWHDPNSNDLVRARIGKSSDPIVLRHHDNRWFRHLNAETKSPMMKHLSIVPSLTSWLGLNFNAVVDDSNDVLVGYDHESGKPVVTAQFARNKFLHMTRITDGMSFINPLKK